MIQFSCGVHRYRVNYTPIPMRDRDMAYFMTYILLSPLYIAGFLAFLLLFALNIVPLCVLWVYEFSTRKIVRNHLFYCVACLFWFLYLPALTISVAWVGLICIYAFAVSFPIFLLRQKSTLKSLSCLWNAHRPEEESEEYMWSFFDIFYALYGVIHRQDIKLFIALPATASFVPIVKMHNYNPTWNRLEHVFINQWSTNLHAKNRFDLMAEIIRDSKLSKCGLEMNKTWNFTGHHPLPPTFRKNNTNTGIQMGKNGYFLLLSHTSHGGLPRSSHASACLIKVRLKWWNPWYHVVGYVEVNARKDGGVEHPMWIIADVHSFSGTSSLRSINKTFLLVFCNFATYIIQSKKKNFYSLGKGECQFLRTGNQTRAVAEIQTV